MGSYPLEYLNKFFVVDPEAYFCWAGHLCYFLYENLAHSEHCYCWDGADHSLDIEPPEELRPFVEAWRSTRFAGFTLQDFLERTYVEV